MNSYTLNHSKFLKKNINTFIVGVVLFFNLATSGSVSAKVSSLKSSSAKSISTSTQPQFSAANSSALEGNLFAFKEVKNGQYAFASLSYKSIPNIKGKAQKSGVVAVFQKVSGGWKWLRNIVVNSPSLNNTGDVYSAYGFALTPDESILAVAMDKKVALLNVNAAIKGNITPQYVSLDTNYLNSTGAIAVVAAKDNKHFFIADEYGRFKEKSGIGDIAIISATLMKSGTVKGQRLGYIKTGQNSIPSLNISPDGKTLYVPNLGASEAVSAKFSLSNNSILSKNVQIVRIMDQFLLLM